MKFGCSLCVATRPIILAYFCYLVSKPSQQKNYLAWAIAVKTVSRLCCNLTFWRFNTQVPHNKTPLLLIPVNMILNTFHFKGSQIGFDAFYFHQHLCCCSASFLHLRLSSRNCLKNNFILHFRDFQHTFINNTNINNFLTNNSINICFSASFILSSLKVEHRCYAWAEKE